MDLIEIDSIYRDKYSYPSPFEFIITPDQTREWQNNPRMAWVKNLGPGSITKFTYPTSMLSNTTYTLELLDLTVPYDASLLAEPRLYMSFSAGINSRRGNILSANRTLHNTNFVCTREKILYDALNNPIYIVYSSKTRPIIQVDLKDSSYYFSLHLREELKINLFDSDPIYSDPSKQIHATISLIPTILDPNINWDSIDPKRDPSTHY